MRQPDLSGAACRGHERLFSATGAKGDTERRRVCHSCPEIPVCFVWSVEHEGFGFWAGLNAAERARIRVKYSIKFLPPLVHNERALEMSS